MLIIRKVADGHFSCIREEDESKVHLIGHGRTIMGAVGAWALISQTLEIRCDPPSLFTAFTVSDDLKTVKKTTLSELWSRQNEMISDANKQAGFK